MGGARILDMAQTVTLIELFRARFEANMGRHRGLDWEWVHERLKAWPEKLWSLSEMERTGGEPDAVGLDEASDRILFFDCASESPKGRRSICYDREGLEERKDFKPETTAVDLAAAMGIELLTEEQYRFLQGLGEFDLKTSSWVKTPAEVRRLGGALFCDRRYGRVFTYHNGASSYYGVRGFRGVLEV
ncbi:MAG TPA: DUF4256 domain-containing protein [Rectinemataceae bacterium]